MIRSPTVSPDGRRIIFQVYRDGVWMLDVRSGSMCRVLDDPTAEEYSWSPDGHRVAFHSQRAGGWASGCWGSSRFNRASAPIPFGLAIPRRRVHSGNCRRSCPVASVVFCSVLAVSVSPEAPQPVKHEAAADIRLPTEFETIRSRVPAHTTLDRLLRDNRLQDSFVLRAVEAAQSVFNLRQLRADREFRLVRSLDGMLREFDNHIDADRFLSIVNHNDDDDDGEAFEAQVLPYDKHIDVVAIDARIDAAHLSLIAAIDASGENVQLAMELAEIFGGEIDFQSELQPGDSFRVLFEKTSHDGAFSGTARFSERRSSSIAAHMRRSGGRTRRRRVRRPSTTRAGDR